jgi:hypothetical protein
MIAWAVKYCPVLRNDIHKIPLLDPILNQEDPVHVLTPHSLSHIYVYQVAFSVCLNQKVLLRKAFRNLTFAMKLAFAINFSFLLRWPWGAKDVLGTTLDSFIMARRADIDLSVVCARSSASRFLPEAVEGPLGKGIQRFVWCV